MVYSAGDVPVGDYNPNRLANIGIGHGAIDFGAGYTYLNPATGIGILGRRRRHLQFQESRYSISERRRFPFRLGRVAISVQAGLCRLRRLRLSTDHRRFRPTGCSRRLPLSRSTASVRRSDTFSKIGENQAFLGLKGYGEFDADNRPHGWNTWVTFSISEAVATTVTPVKHHVTK